MRTLTWLLIAVMAQTPQGTAVVQRALPGVSDLIDGKILRETPHFSIYAENGFMPVDLNWLQAEAEIVYAYVAERMGVRTGERFAIAFRKPDTATCPIRGLARSDPPVAQVIVFADEQTARAQILGVIAHEVGHLLHFRALKAGTRFDELNEGLATWAAGKYWEAWQQASISETVNALKHNGRYVALTDYFREDAAQKFSNASNCLNDRDRRYTSWAAFLDFLIANHGMDKVRQLLGPAEEIKGPIREPVRVAVPIGGGGFDIDELIRGGFRGFRTEIVTVPPPIPDFPGVYGRTLDELETAWWEQITKTR